MKNLLLLIIFSFSMNCSQAQIQSLDDFQWKNRLLVLYTSNENSVKIDDQLAEILKAKNEFQERDLKVIILKNQMVKIWNSTKRHSLNFDQIIQELNINTEKNYQNLLIGKDGGVKLRADSPISNQKLFSTIDVMPMRQREMKDRN